MTTQTNTETNTATQPNDVSWIEKDYTIFAELDTKLRKFEAAVDNTKAKLQHRAGELTTQARDKRDAAWEALDALRSGAKSTGEDMKASARRALDRFKTSMDEAEAAWKGASESSPDVQ